MSMKPFLLLGVLVMLAGCQTQQVEEMSYSQRNALAKQIAERCAAQGYADGHPKQDECIRLEVTREVATRRNNQARADNARMAISSGLSTYGQSLQQSGYNQQLNCTTTPQSTFVGGTPSSYSTSCY
jgi:hypothetical protein